MFSRMIKNLANEIPVGPILWGVNHWLVDFVFVITLVSTIFLNRRTFSNRETRSLGLRHSLTLCKVNEPKYLVTEGKGGVSYSRSWDIIFWELEYNCLGVGILYSRSWDIVQIFYFRPSTLLYPVFLLIGG